MIGFGNTWRVYWKGPSGDYVELGVCASRNVSGGALVSVASGDQDLGYTYGSAPVVVRYEVTGKNGTSITLTRKLVLAADIGYVLSPTEVLVTAGTVATTLFYGAGVIVAADCSIGDIFEIGEGYSWDSTNAQWISQRAFGILPQGQFGNTHKMRIQNISGQGQAFVLIDWSNNGTQIIQARQVNGAWKNQSQAPIMAVGAQGIDGYVDTDEELEFEFRPHVPDATDSSDNPITISVNIDSEAI